MSAGGDFQILNGNQLAILPSNVPASTYLVIVQVTSNNFATFSQSVAITISPASTSTVLRFLGAAGVPSGVSSITAVSGNNVSAAVQDGNGLLHMPASDQAGYFPSLEQPTGPFYLLARAAPGDIASLGVCWQVQSSGACYRLKYESAYGLVQFTDGAGGSAQLTYSGPAVTSFGVYVNGSTFTAMINGVVASNFQFTSTAITATGYVGVIGAYGSNDHKIQDFAISSALPIIYPATQMSVAISPNPAVVGTARSVVLTPGGSWPDTNIITMTASNGLTLGSATIPPGAVGTTAPVSVSLATGSAISGSVDASSSTLSSLGAVMTTSAAPVVLSAPLAFTNSKTTPVAARSPITIGHAFVRGDVPAGNSVAVSGMTVQQDQEAYWGDGSLRFAALSLLDGVGYGANGGGSDTLTKTVTASSSPPDRTAAFTLAQFVAANDVKVLFTGFDAGSDTFALSFNDIIAHGTQSPWDNTVALSSAVANGATTLTVSDTSMISVGMCVSTDGLTNAGGMFAGPVVIGISGTTVTVLPGLSAAVPAGGKLHFNTPVCGWELTRSGRNCMEWRAWGFIRVVGGSNAGKYHRQIKGTLYVRSWGLSGPHEIEAVIENSQAYGNHPYGSIPATASATAQRFLSLATVQNGSKVLAYFGGPNDPRATTIAASAINTSTAALTGLTLDNGTGFYLTPQTGATLPGGLSSTTPYWTAAGLLALDKINMANTVGPTHVPSISSAGSGTLNVIPIFDVFAQNCRNLATSTAEPIWDAGSSGIAVRPHMLPTFDHAYLDATAVAGLAYDWTKTTYPRTVTDLHDRDTYIPNLGTFYAGQEQPWQTPWAISQYGDDPGDERVGPNTNLNANLYYQQTDVICDLMVRVSARRFWDYTACALVNDRSAKPMAYNNGPQKNGGQYPGLGPVDFTAITGNVGSSYPFQGDTQDTVNMSGHRAVYAYGAPVDASHLPCPSNGVYHRYGHRSHLDQMHRVCGTLTFNMYSPTATVGGNIYYHSLVADNSTQMRSYAWQLRYFSNADYFTPSADLYKPYLQDQLDEAAVYLVDYYRNGMPALNKALGLWNLVASNALQNLYQYTYFGLILCVIAKRDQDARRTGILRFIRDHVSNCLVKMMDPTQGGGFFRGCDGGSHQYSGNVAYKPDGQPDTATFQTPQDLWGSTENGPIAYPQPSGFNGGTFQGNYPFDCVAYSTSHLAFLAEGSRLGVPGASGLYATMKTAATTSPYSGVIWSQSSNQHYDKGTPQNYMPWCVAPPNGVAAGTAP